MSDSETNSPVREKTLIDEHDATLIPLSEEEVLSIDDKHPRDMPEMAFVIAFCIQYNEAVGNLNFLPEELEDAIVCREPVDLVERVHRYFLRNVLNVSKIIDKRYWIRKMSQHLHERVEKKEFIFSYNPFERVDNVYHELSNFEKVMILKDLVMWQFKESEKIQEMWQSKESQKAQTLHDQETENVARPVEVEVLGVDSKGSTYFYLGAGSRIYRETPSVGECIWESLTTTLQDLKDLISERVEIDPDRSEKELLLYNRISKELIPDIESQIEQERAAEEAAMIRRGGKRARDYIRYKRKIPSSVEETENAQVGVEDDDVPEKINEPSLNADEPILSVSMWSVTRPSTNLQPAQTVHDIRCFPANQEAESSSVTADSNGIINSPTTEIPAELPETSSTSEDDVATTILSSNQSIFTERRNSETSTLNNVTSNKRRVEEETSDDNYSSDSMGSNKRVKFYDEDVDEGEVDEVDDEEYYDNDDYNDDDYYDDGDYYDEDDDDVDADDVDDDDFDVDYESCYVDTTKRAMKEKGKEVLRNNPGFRSSYINKFTAFVKPKVDKGKGVLRHEESSRIGEGSSVSHGYNIANITRLSEEEDSREIFRPGPEDQIKLDWSLNHIFFEGLEIFGEDSDSELSDCCDACMMEVDHSYHS